MTDTAPNQDSDPQIWQDVKGDRNQTIGQVLGGMVVYGQVIYNNLPLPQIHLLLNLNPLRLGRIPTRDCWPFMKPMVIAFWARSANPGNLGEVQNLT